MRRFTNLFNKFDVDGSGEISTLELSQILRNLGYPTSVDVLQGLVTEVGWILSEKTYQTLHTFEEHCDSSFRNISSRFERETQFQIFSTIKHNFRF